MTNEQEQRQRPDHKREAMVGIILPSAALVASVAFWGHSIFVDITDHILVISERVASNTTHRIAHERESQQWMDRIRSNERSARELERAVAGLQSTLPPSQDPVTGADGSVLRRHRDRLEAESEGN